MKLMKKNEIGVNMFIGMGRVNLIKKSDIGLKLGKRDRSSKVGIEESGWN